MPQEYVANNTMKLFPKKHTYIFGITHYHDIADWVSIALPSTTVNSDLTTINLPGSLLSALSCVKVFD